MAVNKKKFEESFLDSMESELMLTQSRGSGLNIIEFVEQILDSFDMDLFIQQRVLLKAIYNIEFTSEERALMDKWVRENKCNWKPPEEVLEEINAKRAERGMTEMRESFVYQDIVFQAGMRCITGDSYLFLPSVGYLKIKDLLPQADANDKETPLAATIQTRHGFKDVVAGLSRTPTETRRVKTQHGYEIEGSLEHPLLVKTSDGLVWKKMAELQNDDCLCIEVNPLTENAYPEDHKFTYEGKTIDGSSLAYVLGLFAGSGNQEEYGLQTKLSINHLQKSFLGLDEKSKEVPTWVMQGSQEEIKQYLRGLFTANGFPLTHKVCIKLFLFSKEMSRQVQILLLGFGIISSRNKKSFSNNDVWELEISNKNVFKFEKVISFGVAGKASVVESYGLNTELKHFKNDLPNNNLFFDKIVSIQEGQDYVYDICVPEVSEYVANGIVSHNSGKSSTVAICVVYEFYKLITADNPQKELGVPSSSSVYLTVLASTEEQTKNTIYGYVKSYVLNTTFFKSKINRGEIIVKELEITCPGKNITIGSGHSRATSVVGRSAVLVCFDELAMFANEEGGSSNAAEVYSRVGRAAATFRDKSKRIAMSSVKNQGDYMQELVEKNWDKQIRGALCFDVSTFDFNPFMTPETAIIAADYDKDIVAAQRDYENIRPGSLYGFLNPVIVEMAAHEVARDQKGNEFLISRDPMINCISRPIEIHRSIDTGETRIMSGLEIGSVKPAPLGQYQSIGHCDPGLDHDSFGFACGHAEYAEKGIITVIDIVLEWIPKNLGKNKTAKIDFINVEEVLLEVAKARQIIRLSFDHWQGESHIQRLYREGIPTTAMHFSGTLQLKMYESLRTRLNQGLVKIPNHPTLMEELKNLELKNGTRVDHPKNKASDIQGRGFISKDLADCVAVVNWIIASQERSFIRELGQQQGSPNIVTIPSVHAIGNMRAKTNIDWNMGFQ